MVSISTPNIGSISNLVKRKLTANEQATADLSNHDWNPSDVWTLAVIPDTQRLFDDSCIVTNGGAQHFTDMCQYISDQKDSKNIKAVLHLGDVVQINGNATHFASAGAGRDIIDAMNIPYLFGIGNWDYNDGGQGSSRNSTNFNNFFQLSLISGESWFVDNYETGKSENCAVTMTHDGVTWLIFNVEFYPRTGVMDWVKNTVSSQNPDFVIIQTHSYIDADPTIPNPESFWDGIHIIDGAEYGPDSYGSAYTTSGVAMWNDMVSQIEECVLVVSGHILDIRHSLSSNPTGTNNGGVVHSGKQDTHSGGTICTQIAMNHQNDTIPACNNTGNASACTIHFFEFDQTNRQITKYSYDPVYTQDPSSFGNFPTSNPDWDGRQSLTFNY